LYKKYQKRLRSKGVRSFCKDMPTFGLAAILDPIIIFIILIIILNLHDSSLSESSCNTESKSLGCGFGCNVVL